MAEVSDYTALLYENSWNGDAANGVPVIVSYSFVETNELPSHSSYKPYSNNGYSAFTFGQRDSFRAAVDEFSKISGMKFVETTDETKAFIKVMNTSGSEWGGWAGQNSYLVIDRTGNYQAGTSGFETLLHEIGHSVGLKHPFDGDPTLVTHLDNDNYTLMSYTSNQRYDTSLPTLDVDALRFLYGSDNGELSSWDVGKIVATNQLFLDGSAQGERVQLMDTTAIVHGNGGNDTIIGGAELHGGAGNDFLAGSGSGVNYLYGGEGHDTLNYYGFTDFYNGGDGNDKISAKFISFGASIYLDSNSTNYSDIEDIEGSAQNDYLWGNAMVNIITGGDGNDHLRGMKGDDYLNGGDGTDIAAYQANSKAISLSLFKSNDTELQHRVANGEGTDRLVNIETLNFYDRDLNLGSLTGVVNVSSADLTVFIEMYIAYFNRTPDAEGLFYWGTRLNEGMALQDIAKSFFVQDETKALYPNPSDTSGFVTSVYNNFLGRTPDADGFAYWVKQLNDNIVTRDVFMLAIINGAKASTGNPADVDYITGKAKIGSYFSVIKGMSDTDNAKAAMALYNGSAASLSAAKNAVDNFYNAALDANNGEFLINLVGVMDDPFAV